MLFITNYNINESKDWSPSTGNKTRKITLNSDDPEPGRSIYFCQRQAKGDYREIGNKAFFNSMKGGIDRQILIYIHGFNNQPEDDVFPRAKALQKLYNDGLRTRGDDQEVEVVVILWPCSKKGGIVKDYWDDQDSSDMSAHGFGRMLGKFMTWREKSAGTCYRPINILAHSMGNRVLRLTLERWLKYRGNLPALFRNIFMVAADVANETLEAGEPGHAITQSARNVAVYYANDDLAMTASKVANVKNKVASRRLGHTGPERMEFVPDNVFAIDCDDVNNAYDTPKGHSYFLREDKMKGDPGVVFKHIFETTVTGRVPADPATRREVLEG